MSKENAKTFEGYFRPVLVQLQWCSSILVLINTMFLVLGTPSWVKIFYAVFPIFVIGWVFYYFKRGRRQELTNIVQDNPIYDEVKRLRAAVEELGSKLKPPSIDRSLLDSTKTYELGEHQARFLREGG